MDLVSLACSLIRRLFDDGTLSTTKVTKLTKKEINKQSVLEPLRALRGEEGDAVDLRRTETIHHGVHQDHEGIGAQSGRSRAAEGPELGVDSPASPPPRQASVGGELVSTRLSADPKAVGRCGAIHHEDHEDHEEENQQAVCS